MTPGMPRPRSFTIAQFPNPPLITAGITAAIAHITHGQTAAAAKLASRIALLVWSTEEIIDGANWFRRLLGIAGAAWTVAAVARPRGRG